MFYVRSSRKAGRTPFLTEIGESKPQSCSHRVKPTVPFISPFKKKKVPQNNIQKHQSNSGHYDALDLQIEYKHLLNEVQTLRSEVQTHREAFIRLKDELFLTNRGVLDSEIEYAERAPALNAAVGRGAFSMAIGSLSVQSKDNQEEMVDLREQLAPMVVLKLEDRVRKARTLLISLKAEIEAMKNAENATRAKIEAIRLQFSPAKMQTQRDEIRDLVTMIRTIEKKNAKLNHSAEILEVQREQRELPLEKQIECKAMEDMTGQLQKKRKQFYDKCDESIEIKSQQLVDVTRAELEQPVIINSTDDDDEWKDSD
jgi:hypothetical protein